MDFCNASMLSYPTPFVSFQSNPLRSWFSISVRYCPRYSVANRCLASRPISKSPFQDLHAYNRRDFAKRVSVAQNLLVVARDAVVIGHVVDADVAVGNDEARPGFEVVADGFVFVIAVDEEQTNRPLPLADGFGGRGSDRRDVIVQVVTAQVFLEAMKGRASLDERRVCKILSPSASN